MIIENGPPFSIVYGIVHILTIKQYCIHQWMCLLLQQELIDHKMLECRRIVNRKFIFVSWSECSSSLPSPFPSLPSLLIALFFPHAQQFLVQWILYFPTANVFFVLVMKKEIKSSSKWFVKIYHYAAVSLNLVPGLFPKFSVVLCTAEELGRSLGTRLTFAQWIKIVVSVPRELRTLRELLEQQKWCKMNQSFLILQPLAVKITYVCVGKKTLLVLTSTWVVLKSSH